MKQITKSLLLVILTLVVVIFFWPKPYYQVPAESNTSIVEIPAEENQQCIGIKIKKNYPMIIKIDCYGWVTPPNDTRIMFKGFERPYIY